MNRRSHLLGVISATNDEVCISIAGMVLAVALVLDHRTRDVELAVAILGALALVIHLVRLAIIPGLLDVKSPGRILIEILATWLFFAALPVVALVVTIFTWTPLPILAEKFHFQRILVACGLRFPTDRGSRVRVDFTAPEHDRPGSVAVVTRVSVVPMKQVARPEFTDHLRYAIELENGDCIEVPFSSLDPLF